MCHQTVYGVILFFLTGSTFVKVNIDLDRKKTNLQSPAEILKKNGPYKSTIWNLVKQTPRTSKSNTSDLTRKITLNKPLVKRFTQTLVRNTKHQSELDIKDGNQGKQSLLKNTLYLRRKDNYLVHWYNPPKFLKFRRNAYSATFSGCEYSNCRVTYDNKLAGQSDVVIFDGRWVPEKLEFKRPAGQVWIFAAHESPETYDDLGNWWTKPQWVSSFNWTMTYAKDTADIHLPYGEIRPTTVNEERNFTEIALAKKKTALAIISHCSTHSLREMYIKKLQGYIDIDVLGYCGQKWKCGKRYLHDGCFQILNSTYLFFLSFENAMCEDYFTEKLFENFNYDIVLVVRGGRQGDVTQHLPNGTYITTDDFKSARELGRYLRRLKWSLADYTQLLRTKSNYKSEPFDVVYKKALCNVCKRMNHQGHYKKTILNIEDFLLDQGKCRLNPKF